MFSLNDRRSRLCDGYSRRELLRAGGLSLMGLSLPQLLAASDSAPPSVSRTFGRAKNVIFLYLAGGPPQHETFDPKPDAPIDIRGAFNPIQTNIPGMQFCELLPRTAGIADKLAVVRSMATDDNTHSSSSYWVLTGYKYLGGNARTIQPSDWPYFGSIIKRYRPSETLPPLSTVWIPDIMRLNENVTPAGQTGGFMGAQWDPDRFVGDPAAEKYEVQGLEMANLPPLQLKRRQKLLSAIEQHFDSVERGGDLPLYNKFQQQAFDLLTSGKAREAFAIEREPAKLRERYGKNRWGQCVLLARRLIEAGVRLVHVQWPREPGDNAADNPLWDTHAQNADRLEDVLCPQFDVGFSALIEDLDQRGLLDETLVVAIGEFGRTPKINAKGGRDHWGPVFSFAMAGAGISGGQVYGASDKQGAYPADKRVEPGDLTATIFHLLGLDHQGGFHDQEGREHRLTNRKPILDLLGERPATDARVPCAGDVSRVPPFDPTITLVQTDFQNVDIFKPLDAPSRPKGWRAGPLADDDQTVFGAALIDKQAWLGLRGGDAAEDAIIKKGDTAIVAQEVRSPFSGTYRMEATLSLESDSEEAEKLLAEHFTCRLLFLQFNDQKKNASQRKDLASVVVKPQWNKPQPFVLEKEFINPKPGSNFSFGSGLGVAILLEKTSDGELKLASIETPMMGVRVSKVALTFAGKKRNEKVKV